MTTEREKMLAGKPYKPSDTELKVMRVQAHKHVNTWQDLTVRMTLPKGVLS